MSNSILTKSIFKRIVAAMHDDYKNWLKELKLNDTGYRPSYDYMVKKKYVIVRQVLKLDKVIAWLKKEFLLSDDWFNLVLE